MWIRSIDFNNVPYKMVWSKEQYRLATGICTRRKSGICQGALELTRMLLTSKFMILFLLPNTGGSLKIG